MSSTPEEIAAWQRSLYVRDENAGQIVDINTRLTRLEAQTLGTRVTTVETAITNLTWGVWHIVGGLGEPAFQNSWTNFGSGWQTARFRSNAYQVEIQGLVKSGNINTTVFTLPSVCRPFLTLRFEQYGVDNGGQQLPMRIDVDNAGGVTLSNGLTFTAGPTWGNPTGNASISCIFGLGV